MTAGRGKLSNRSLFSLPYATTLLYVVCLSGVLAGVLSTARGEASVKSILSVSAYEVRPGESVQCIIRVMDAQGSPSMDFKPEQFKVSATSTSAEAVVFFSNVRRGQDITTAVFQVQSTEPGDIVIHVYVVPRVNESLQGGPIVHSGSAVSVLSFPATAFGKITCNTPPGGLSLRNNITCEAPLLDTHGKPALVHPQDVLLVEHNQLGSFHFVNGVSVLRFLFCLGASPSVTTNYVTIRVALIGSHFMSELQIPVIFPSLPPAPENSTVQCVVESMPMICTIVASDGIGPVAFRTDDFEVSVEAHYDSMARWISSTVAFDIELTNSLLNHDRGQLRVKLKNNNASYPHRLHVGLRPIIPSTIASLQSAPLVGSPVYFNSGIVPTHLDVALRGCLVAVIRTRSQTDCFIDLLHGVTGDVRYYTLRSSLNATFSNVHFVAKDPVTQGPSITFTYIAPAVASRSDDYISVSVAGAWIGNSPFRMNVFASVGNPENNDPSAEGSAILIGTGLAFYGSVLGSGFIVVLRRSRKIRRLQRKRMAKENGTRRPARQS